MSGKLLHERLRELENWHQLYERYAINEVSFDKLMNAFADEIERQYVPVPRFPDGTRVEMGCKVEGGTVECWCVLDDGSFDLYNDEGDTIHEGKPGDFAKPPETDSLEKLRDDLKEYVEAIGADVPDGRAGDALRCAANLIAGSAARLTALMERGA